MVIQVTPPTQATQPTPEQHDPAAQAAFGVDTWRQLAYPNRVRPLPKGLDAWWHAAAGRLRHLRPSTRTLLRSASRVCRLSEAIKPLRDTELDEELGAMHALFRRGRDDRAALLRAAALVREAARRSLGMEPYPVQLAAGLGLTQRRFVELATGEGKTLVATLPAVIAGWRGRGCHVLTVNDYLAQRDADLMRPLYARCGLTVAAVQEEMDPGQRRSAYLAGVTYCTNKSVTADYLRDRLALGRLTGLTDALLARRLGHTADRALRGRPDQLVMRSLDTAIVDEADSILIDESVTPLIISTDSGDEQRIASFAVAAELAGQLKPGDHFTINATYREADFTLRGRQLLAKLCDGMDGYWQGARLREELVNQALCAKHLFLRDQHYVVSEGKVVIVDESTGRQMPDRTWRSGLHQAVEAKEGLEVTTPKDTLARISFQRFFRGYRKLSGMSGTGWEAKHELWQNYKLVTTRIPTNKPCIRTQLPERVFATTDAKLDAMALHIREMHEKGRPVLIGTRSVESSERISVMLDTAQLPHRVLNAVRHAEEAQIVSDAGRRGAVTVATNMAGRGTDIKLGPGVVELGGLHVVCAERNDARRIDRQLFGRAGRQGDPGSAVTFSALDDALLKRYGTRTTRAMTRSTAALRGASLSLAQRRAQRLGREQRRQVMRMDDQLNEQLGFAGREH